jgi:hypothetical protein
MSLKNIYFFHLLLSYYKTIETSCIIIKIKLQHTYVKLTIVKTTKVLKF